jgi:transposase-like protein
MKKQVSGQAFRQMAVELSYAWGSVKEAAAESGIDPGRISKWRQHQNDSVAAVEKPGLTAGQAEIKRLQKELKEAQLERDILWRRSASFPGERANIPVCKGAPGTISG